MAGAATSPLIIPRLKAWHRKPVYSWSCSLSSSSYLETEPIRHPDTILPVSFLLRQLRVNVVVDDVLRNCAR